jgi:regulation of enolase protein 1 (concanavalin A-like superfamily)
MQVQESNIFGAGSSDVDNLFIHPVSKPNYSAEVTVSLNPNLPFEQAGLDIYWDNDNYIKISKEMFMGEHSLVFVVEQNGRPDIKKRLLIDKETVSVMLEKKESMISAYFRSNTNAKWQLIDSTNMLAAFEPEQTRGYTKMTFGLSFTLEKSILIDNAKYCRNS